MRLTRIYPTDTYLALSEIESVQPYVEKVNYGRCVKITMRSGEVHNLTIVRREQFAKPGVTDAQFTDWLNHGPLAPILEG